MWRLHGGLDVWSSPSLAALPMWAVTIVVVLFLVISVILVLTVLIQRPMGGGLAAAFGGGGGSGATAFGTKTGNALTWATCIMFGLFVLLACVLNIVTGPDESRPTQVAPTGTEQPAGGAAPATPPEVTSPSATLPSTTPTQEPSTGVPAPSDELVPGVTPPGPGSTEQPVPAQVPPPAPPQR